MKLINALKPDNMKLLASTTVAFCTHCIHLLLMWVVAWISGTDKIPVIDTQELKLNGGESFEVISSPVLQVIGS